MEDNFNVSLNKRPPQFLTKQFSFEKLEADLNFKEMENDHNFKVNGRKP